MTVNTLEDEENTRVSGGVQVAAAGMASYSGGAPEADIMTKAVPNDPYLNSGGIVSWHLISEWGLHADRVWPDYTGAGIRVADLDDGFQYTHSDLSANYRTDLDYDTLGNDYDAAPGASSNNHGTATMGVILADDNGVGGVGVAFDAQGIGIRIGFGSDTDISNMVEGFQYALGQHADVMNNSWGFNAAFSDNFQLDFTGADLSDVGGVMKDTVDFGRDGLGGNIVFAAGNGRAAGDNVNYHNFQNSPYVITVAAIDSSGVYSSFSTPGAALLVAAGGSSIVATDRTGSAGYVSGDYVYFSGTSAAAPVITGLVALMLEANPDLGWRDVQQILAYSAQYNDPGSAGWQYNGAGNWNGGGLHFSHDYGFGAADAFRAVRLAESWTLQQTSANMTSFSAGAASPSVAIPDNGAGQSTITVTQDISIEHVLIHLDISHARAGDLVVTLISPDGTQSVLVNHPTDGSGGSFTSIYGMTGIDFDMSSNADWGESSAGVWTLRVQDTVSGSVGTLNSWSLSFMGAAQSADDLYIFTDDFGGFSGSALAARNVIRDTDGGTDTLNLAAVTSASTINLTAGTGIIAGKAVTVASGTVIENIYGGDGNDTLTGNAADNVIFGGRGNDTLKGMAGNDTLDGGAGSDTAVYDFGISRFSFNIANSERVDIADTLGSLGTDIVENVEFFNFLGSIYSWAQLTSYIQALAALSQIGVQFGSAVSYSDLTGGIVLSALDLSVSGASGNIVSVDRSGSVLTVNYLQLGAPNELKITGSGLADTIIVKGVHTSLASAVDGGDGNDTIAIQVIGAASVLNGGDGSDTITANGGADTIHGDNGNDIVYSANGHDFVYGDAGLDDLHGGGGMDHIYGGAGDDIINGDAGNDSLYGDDGNDDLHGGDGNDQIYGGIGNDKINGDTGNDLIYGGDGVDLVYGGDGNDIVRGEDGRDKVYGGEGDDTLYGGISDDTLYGDGGNDLLYGEDGNDKIYGLTGSDTIYGGAGDDNIYGGASDDFLYGDAGGDTLAGGIGNDRINGGADNDFLYGDNGNDILNGGAGSDTLTGGAGADTFVFSDRSGVDNVTDFAAGDKLDIADILDGFSAGAGNVDDFVRLINETAGGNRTIVTVNNDGTGSDFTQVAVVSGNALFGHTAQDLLDRGFLIATHSS